MYSPPPPHKRPRCKQALRDSLGGLGAAVTDYFVKTTPVQSRAVRLPRLGTAVPDYFVTTKPRSL